MAKIYPSEPKPKIPPVTISLIRDFCLNSSLLYIFEMCNSIIGFLNKSKASLIATDVWVKPAALIIIPSNFFFASCIFVTISPSIFDWKNSIFIFSSFAFFKQSAFIYDEKNKKNKNKIKWQK